jgi:hypothetical protein
MNENINYKVLYENSIVEINILEGKITLLNEHLKKYTAPDRSKKYYDNNKEEIKKKSKEYIEKTNYYQNLSPEKKKEYSKRAYEKKKNKLLENKNI